MAEDDDEPRFRRVLRVYRETSRLAHESIQESLPTLQRQIIGLIEALDGTTCDYIEDMLGMKHQTASARIRELVEAGILMPTKERRLTRSGRKAIVWKVTPEASPEGVS